MDNQKEARIDDGHKSRVLILGLDLGTTSFKIAMLATEEQLGSNALQLVTNPHSHVVVLENFPGHLEHSLSSVPTCLSYSTEATLPKWGHVAERFQSDEDFDSDFFVANWKIALHQSSAQTASRLRQGLQCIAKRLAKSGIDVFAEDFSKCLGDFLFGDEEDSPVIKRYPMIDEFTHIDIVIAVPPGWPRHEHELLSNAVARGLGQERSFRIFRASETECVLRSWMQDPEIQARKGEILLLLDLGGGTVCISAFRSELKQDGTATWTHMESHSLSAGSEIVTEEFVKDFKQRLSDITTVPLTSSLVHKARKKFNKKKVTVGEKSSEADLMIKVPGLKRDVTKDFFEDKMYISGERLLGYFRPSQDQILRKVGQLTDRFTKEYGSPPKYCLTAGAYANNILFRKGLKSANHYDMKIFTLPNSADAVARGACLTRLCGNFSQFAGGASKHSIAILTYIKHSDAIKWYHHAATRQYSNDHVKYTPALLWTIRKGDPIKPNHVVEESGDDKRRRTFEKGEDIIFTDTMFISDSAIPKEEEYTVLRFNTADDSLWRQNMSNLRTRGIIGKLYEVTWDMNDVKLEQKDRSRARMQQTDIGIDSTDPRPKGKRRVMFYKFFLHVSSTDIQVEIQSFHTRKRVNTMIVAQKQILMADQGEYESTALEEEYNNLGVGVELFEDSTGNFEESNNHRRLSTDVNIEVNHSSPHREPQDPLDSLNHSLELTTSMSSHGPRSDIPSLHGVVPAAEAVASGDPKRMALADYPQIPYPPSVTCQGDLYDRGRPAAPQTLTPAAGASSRYRTRSSTPKGSPEQPYQSRNSSVLRESQPPAVSLRDSLSRARTQASLRTPVVPAKRKPYAFEDDMDEYESDR